MPLSARICDKISVDQEINNKQIQPSEDTMS